MQFQQNWKGFRISKLTKIGPKWCFLDILLLHFWTDHPRDLKVVYLDSAWSPGHNDIGFSRGTWFFFYFELLTIHAIDRKVLCFLTLFVLGSETSVAPDHVNLIKNIQHIKKQKRNDWIISNKTQIHSFVKQSFEAKIS